MAQASSRTAATDTAEEVTKGTSEWPPAKSRKKAQVAKTKAAAKKSRPKKVVEAASRKLPAKKRREGRPANGLPKPSTSRGARPARRSTA